MWRVKSGRVGSERVRNVTGSGKEGKVSGRVGWVTLTRPVREKCDLTSVKS